MDGKGGRIGKRGKGKEREREVDVEKVQKLHIWYLYLPIILAALKNVKFKKITTHLRGMKAKEEKTVDRVRM